MTAEITTGFGRRAAAPPKAGPSTAKPARVAAGALEKRPNLLGTLLIIGVFVVIGVNFQGYLWNVVMHHPLEAPAWTKTAGDAWAVSPPADPRLRVWAPIWLVKGLAGLVGGLVGWLLARSRVRRPIGYLRTLLHCLAAYFASWIVLSTIGMVSSMWWSPTGRDPVKLLLAGLMAPLGGVMGGLADLLFKIVILGPSMLIGAGLIYLATRLLDGWRRGRA